MITLTGFDSIARAEAWITTIQRELTGVGEDTALLYLEELQARLRPATPVITGRMKANYYVENWGDGHIELQDRMDYAGFVVFGTRRQRPNPELNALLSNADDELSLLLDEQIAARLAAWKI